MNNKSKLNFLKIGRGKLASDFHGDTEFSKKRKDKVIKEQEEREGKAENKEFGWVKINTSENIENKKFISWDIKNIFNI
jgi:hypothetical protein